MHFNIWLIYIDIYKIKHISNFKSKAEMHFYHRNPPNLASREFETSSLIITQIMLEITCRSTCDQSNVHVARLETGLRQLVYDYLLYSQSSNNYTGQMSCYRRVYGSSWLTESYRTANDWRTLCAVKSTAIWSSGMYCLFCKANDRKPKYNS